MIAKFLIALISGSTLMSVWPNAITLFIAGSLLVAAFALGRPQWER